MDRRLITMMAMAAGIAVLLAGCHPERVVWTPDGQRAAVFNGNGELCFIDGDGTITEPMDGNVMRIAWLPDGQRLVIAKDISVSHWDDAESRIPSALLDDLVRYADFMLESKNQEQWDANAKALKASEGISSNEIKGVKMYLRDRAGSNFDQSLIRSWKDDDCGYNCYMVQVAQWDGSQYSIEKTLFSSGQIIWNLRTSNRGEAVAFTTAYDKDDVDQLTLWVADTQTEKIVKLDENVTMYPDWDTEGTRLFYVRLLSVSDSDDTIGTMLSCRVCNDDGTLLNTFEKPKSWAGLVADAYTRIRCMSDGRVVFSSLEITLPVIGTDVPEQEQLFVLDTRRQTTMARLIPRSNMNDVEGFNMDFFEVSPDEMYISIPDDDGRVGVLSLATGDFKVLQDEDIDELGTVPVWRYPDQLCYIDEVQTDSSSDEKSGQIVLRRPAEDGNWSEPDIISGNWSEQARKDWLD